MNWKTLAASALAFAMAGASFAANPFSDVPRTHWAYKAIQKAVDAGVLEGYDGKFHGQKLINRYQMAVIVKRILDNVGTAGGASAAGMSSEDVRNLEAMMIEFADELALLNVKVSTLEDSFVELRGEVDGLKAGSGSRSMTASSAGLANAFTGFVSVGLMNTDDNAAAVAPAPANAAGSRTRYAGTADQTFFTIPQASIALDHEVSDGIALHVQYDYSTDALNAVGGGVGLNEAYLFVDEIFGDIGGKVGGFAMPFQSWEINGPFRTASNTITPSAKNTFFEAARVVGLELTKTQDVDPADIKWHLGIFSGGDVAMAAGASTVGAMSDAVGLGSLGTTGTFDDQFGYYLDIESGDDPEKDWGWRVGLFDNGGDNSAVTAGAPAIAGLANSQEVDGWQVGFWWKNEDFKVQFEMLDATSEANLGAGVAGGQTDMNAWYFMVNWTMNEDSTITLRYDDWENEINTTPIGGTNGDAFTFAWNKKINDTSMFQFEWISPDEELNTGTSSDVSDDLVQFRYKVWF
jgi:hypothetical protein